MPAGVHNVKVTVGDSDYGSTTLKIQSDIDKLKNVFHGAVQKDPLQLLSLLLGSHSMDKEDIERDIIDILQEKPFNTAFLNLIERLLRLQPTDGMYNLIILLNKAPSEGSLHLLQSLFNHERQ